MYLNDCFAMPLCKFSKKTVNFPSNRPLTAFFWHYKHVKFILVGNERAAIEQRYLTILFDVFFKLRAVAVYVVKPRQRIEHNLPNVIR